MTPRLSPYQIEAREFLLSGLFRCLFDEPGVGKTAPAIMAAWHKVQEANCEQGGRYNTALITAPAYLLSNWEREIRRFLPDAVVVRADGTGVRERRKAFEQHADFILTSYNNWSAKVTEKKSPDFGKYVYPVLVDGWWAAYVFDEGHRLRGHQSACSKHVYRTRLSKSRNLRTPIWVLTGTPFVRDGGDFFTYFHLLDKKRHGSYWRFVNERCVVTENPWTTNVGNIRKSYVAEFNRELAEFSLRRTVAEIPELATLKSTEHHYFVDMPPSVLKMIEKAKKEYTLEHSGMATQFLGGSGALYVSQRKLATVPPTKTKPKIDWLKDFLEDHQEPVVIYTWFRDSARAVAEGIRGRDSSSNATGRQRSVHVVTGDVQPRQRTNLVDEWKRSASGVLVATISALKEGISLTEARHVVFLEHSELPADIEQCTKRLLRRGQTRLVQVHHVHARGTVDMPIKRVLENRGQGFSQALAKWVRETDEESWFT